MSDIGVDFAGTPPGSAAIKGAGFQFVARYLSRYSAKTIKLPEYNDYMANAVGVALVFEDSATQALAGYNQGVLDAQFALAQANALGWPSSRPLYFAVDFDISDAQKPVAGAYMQGVISVIGLARTGAYGGYWWVKYCADNGLASYFWQAVAWSGSNRESRAHLFQQLNGTNINGTAVDIDNALKPDYGQNGATIVNPLPQDVMNIINALWGMPANANNIRDYTGISWHDFIYDALAEQPWAERYDILTNQFPAAQAHITQLEADAITSQQVIAADTKQIADLQAQLNAMNSGDVITITRKGFNGLFDVIKQYFNKK